jgi:Tfp pilus assembly protein PilN
MTVAGYEVVAPASAPVKGMPSSALQRAFLFGTGLGIAIGEKNLEVAIVRARPSGATLLAGTTVGDFRERPAAVWGAELLKFMAAAGEKSLAATVLLPRDEVIVRTVTLPGVADRDIANAIELQIDSLHPWGDVEVSWGWSRAGRDGVLVGLARKELLNSYETLFAEAGVLMAAVTFSTTVIHAALRIWSAAPASILCFDTDARGRTEVYGESESRPVFSAEFSMAQERAVALARAELRLPADYPARPLAELLAPTGASVLAYAAAMAGAATRATRYANLLPAERRASHNRLQYLVPAILAALLLGALIVVYAIFPAVEQRRYRNELDRAALHLEPMALRAQALEKKTAADKLKIAALDDFRRRPQADLDILNELTRLLPPPIWTSAIEIYPDSVVISGEADQAAPLLKVIDSSPLFQNSEFALSVTRNGQSEVFRIKTIRRGRAGRTTP